MQINSIKQIISKAPSITSVASAQQLISGPLMNITGMNKNLLPGSVSALLSALGISTNINSALSSLTSALGLTGITSQLSSITSAFSSLSSIAIGFSSFTNLGQVLGAFSSLNSTLSSLTGSSGLLSSFSSSFGSITGALGTLNSLSSTFSDLSNLTSFSSISSALDNLTNIGSFSGTSSGGGSSTANTIASSSSSISNGINALNGAMNTLSLLINNGNGALPTSPTFTEANTLLQDVYNYLGSSNITSVLSNLSTATNTLVAALNASVQFEVAVTGATAHTETPEIVITNSGLTGGAQTVSYPEATVDNLSNVAYQLATSIATNSSCIANNITATSVGTNIFISANSVNPTSLTLISTTHTFLNQISSSPNSLYTDLGSVVTFFNGLNL